MGKNKSNKPSQSIATDPGTTGGEKKRSQATAFEIDDIFASKKLPRPGSVEPIVAPAAKAGGQGHAKKKDKEKKDKGKSRALVQVEPTVEATSESSPSDSSNDSNDDDEDDDEEADRGPTTIQDISVAIQRAKSKPRVVETVVDPSASIDGYRPPAPGGTGSKAIDEEEMRFRDSRGNARKRTEEGYPVYDVKELKIGLGGGTPDCPFDCQCCF